MHIHHRVQLMDDRIPLFAVLNVCFNEIFFNYASLTRPFSAAQEGDTISLDVMRRVGPQWKHVELVFLVDTSMEVILGASAYQTGIDNRWVCFIVFDREGQEF